MSSALAAQEAACVSPDVIRVMRVSDSIAHYMVQTTQIYDAGLDTLPQMKFWRKIMNMSPDSGFVSNGLDRTIYAVQPSSWWEKLGKDGQEHYRDSLRKAQGLCDSIPVYFTSGKNDFYNAKSVIPDIDRAIPIFVEEGVDPFYAQAILLIESPGQYRKSPAGAAGSFQLMPGVARQMGLVVNKKTDERKDFDKSAWAAAKLLKSICIPCTNAMLDKRGICYDENDLWYRLLVLHVYHAGAGNVEKALQVINPTEGGMWLIEKLWQTKVGAFGKSSQSYSQLVVSAFLELDQALGRNSGDAE
ncbi:MAG TPA: transglycosylase SLT domain-containing protein, partial [Bacteroidia bacterium]|nr:transglycosylase SLT domain-containing protein [Bacteroidia bacterium]